MVLTTAAKASSLLLPLLGSLSPQNEVYPPEVEMANLNVLRSLSEVLKLLPFRSDFITPVQF